ncbi:hypothetical protein J7E62_22150 [Variovorax paradoxus]|nr:hypothetical protein [Variovorax paradoxus]
MGIMPTQEEVRAVFEHMRQNPTDFSAVESPDYSDYLAGSLWRKIKRRVLERDDKTCQSCGGPGSVAHHRSYAQEVMDGNADHLLATVCEGCHALIHFTDQGAKRPSDEWEAVFLETKSQAFPEPHVDLRRNFPPHPATWDRMTAKQKQLWQTSAIALTKEARERKRAKAERRHLSESQRAAVAANLKDGQRAYRKL